MCDRWRGVDGYPNFLADMGECPDGYSIERKDVDGNYEPDNCYWATKIEQARNKRHLRYTTVDGLRMCASELAERYGVNSRFVIGCLDMGLNGDQIAILAFHATEML